MRVVILMGSKSDLPVVEEICAHLDRFGIPWERRVASAHKTPQHLLDLLRAYEADPQPRVYITVAGRSNALSGMVDAHVTAPVIACPPYSERFGGVDLFSSLRMPSGVAPAVVLEPEGAALLAAKMLALHEPALRRCLQEYQERMRDSIIAADREVSVRRES